MKPAASRAGFPPAAPDFTNKISTLPAGRRSPAIYCFAASHAVGLEFVEPFGRLPRPMHGTGRGIASISSPDALGSTRRPDGVCVWEGRTMLADRADQLRISCARHKGHRWLPWQPRSAFAGRTRPRRRAGCSTSLFGRRSAPSAPTPMPTRRPQFNPFDLFGSARRKRSALPRWARRGRVLRAPLRRPLLPDPAACRR